MALRTVIYPVKDLAAAKAFYGALLGVDPIMDEPYYVQFTAGDLEVGLDPHGHSKGLTGAVAYWQVADIKDSIERLIAAGAQEHDAVKDFGDGKLVGSVRDRDGNVVGLVQPA